jgi:hypothetical protein
MLVATWFATFQNRSPHQNVSQHNPTTDLVDDPNRVAGNPSDTSARDDDQTLAVPISYIGMQSLKMFDGV